jgi:hypothetical protein
MFWRWLLSGILLMVSIWCANLALGNWWAAGGPPTEYRETFLFRGNVFFALATFFLLATAFTVILNIRQLRRR